METYLKAVLYAYPLLKTVEKDYAEHIRNKALLSYDSNKTTEKLAEYLAEEILRKERLCWLKKTVEQVCSKLSEEERTLVAIRYFGKKRKKAAAEKQEDGADWAKSERMYFRRQNRAGEKAAALLRNAGVDEATYRKYFADIETFQKIHKYLEKHERKTVEKK